MEKHVSDNELAGILREVGHPDLQDAPIAQHRAPAYAPEAAAPKVVEVRLADMTIGEWFMRILKFVVALFLVGLVLALPGALLHATLTFILATRPS